MVVCMPAWYGHGGLLVGVVAMSVSAVGLLERSIWADGAKRRRAHCGALLPATYGLLGEDLDRVFVQTLGKVCVVALGACLGWKKWTRGRHWLGTQMELTLIFCFILANAYS